MKSVGYIYTMVVFVQGKSEHRYRIVASNGCFLCDCHTMKTAKRILNALELAKKVNK